MTDKDETGYDLLVASAIEQAARTAEDIVETCEETGPARLLFCALQIVAKIGLREHESVAFIPTDQSPPDHIDHSTKLYVSASSTTEDHTDFAIWAYDHTGRVLGKIGWRRAVVEIESAGSAPEVSSSFLGRGRHGKDVHILRFTSGEVEVDPWGAASKIFDWASWSFG